MSDLRPSILKRFAARLVISAVVTTFGGALAIAQNGIAQSHGDSFAARLAGVSPGQWVDMGPSTRLSTIGYTGPNASCPNGPSAASIEGTNGPAAINYAWNGAVLDTDNEQLVFPALGGHSDYYGNAVYALKLSNLTFSMLLCPSPTAGWSGKSETMPDGNPVSRHLYGGGFFMPGRGVFIAGGARATDGAATHATWLFDTRSRSWSQKGSWTTRADGYGATTIYDAANGKAYAVIAGPSGFESFDGTEWRTAGETGGDRLYRQAVLDAANANIYLIGGGSGRLERLAIAMGILTRDLVVSGARGCIDTAAPGAYLDPSSHHLIAWCGGTDIYSYDINHAGSFADPIPAMRIAAAANSATPACTDEACTSLVDNRSSCSRGSGTHESFAGFICHGTYGRFFYDAHYDVACVINGFKDDMACRKRGAND